MTAEIRLLGDVEVHVDEHPVDVGHSRQRCVLVALLADPARVVSVERLIDRVWGDRLPRRPRNALYGYVSRLRAALGDEARITQQSRGYLLEVDPMAVDLHRFRALVRRARASEDDQARAALFDEACGLWRGNPFGSLNTPWLNGMRATVEAEWFAAELDRTDVQLRLGGHAELLPRLQRWSEAHPLDERLAAQLMLALYHCGRQAEALDHYQRIRARLAEELGADPSPALQRLHLRALSADLTVAVAPSRQSVPHQLPAPPGAFVGRAAELAELARTGRTDPATLAISVIGGVGGVGKTWLALRWAHDNADRFPDGQLYVNLRGFEPTGQPVPWPAAVRGFLHALGVDPAAIPADPDAQAALFRSTVAGRRMLVVLDNARDTEQVTPLLPGSPSVTVLVTSRRQLSGLRAAFGARLLTLDLLADDEARQLLTSQLPAGQQPEAVTELLKHCDGLPLALSIVAARAAARPHFPLSVLAEELRDAGLDALDAGELSANLRAVFSSSYEALDGRAATMFGLLGLAPGPDVELAAAAGLGALPAPATAVLLRALTDAHLVLEHRPGRYRMHDLVRLYAIDRALRDQPSADRVAALRRLVDFHLHTACRAADLLYPHRPPIDLDPPAPGCVPLDLPDRAAALAWFEANNAGLRAVQRLALEHSWDTVVWQVAWALTIFHLRRGHLQDHFACWRAGLVAADRLGAPMLQAHAHRQLGQAYGQASDHAAAEDHLKQALTLSSRCGDLFGEARAHQLLAWIRDLQDDHLGAWLHAARLVRLSRLFDNPVWTATALETAGWCLARLGHHELGRVRCAMALAVHREHGHREGEAEALNSLGYIAHHTGRHQEALHHYHQALILRRECGDVYAEACTLEHLGETYLVLGQDEAAREVWRQALALYRAQHRAGQAARAERLLASSS